MATSLVVGLLTATACRGESGPAGLDPAVRAALADTARGLLVEAIPERIEVQDDWGQTESKFSGLTWRRDGLKLNVERREREMNHGLWKRADITPVDPAKNLRFEIVSATSIGLQRIGFSLRVRAPLAIHARIERWRSGVKLLNFSTEAEAVVQTHLDGDVEYEFQTLDDGIFLVLRPRVLSVDLYLADFHWKRIGPAEGWAVQELGNLIDHPLGKQLDRQEPRVVEKLNQAIAKRQEKWRVKVAAPFELGNLTDWLTGK